MNRFLLLGLSLGAAVWLAPTVARADSADDSGCDCGSSEPSDPGIGGYGGSGSTSGKGGSGGAGGGGGQAQGGGGTGGTATLEGPIGSSRANVGIKRALKNRGELPATLTFGVAVGALAFRKLRRRP